uniref:CSON008676 protein n=1 Tax=Culicoides sonorensis TaxID=179676 RepID=A0A336MYW9_CULSO
MQKRRVIVYELKARLKLPEEYLKLIQQLSAQHQQYSQSPVVQIPERAVQNSIQKPRPRVHNQPRPSPTELQYINAQQAGPQEQGVQYITEEEYVKLLENQKQYEAGQAAQHAYPNQVQGPLQQHANEGLGNFRLPQQSSQKLPAAYNRQPQVQPTQQQLHQQQQQLQLHQQQHQFSRPLTDFDKELALLVESNKPISLAHQAQPLPRQHSLKQAQQQQQQQVVQIPQRPQSHNEPIYAPQHLPPPQNVRYGTPANIQYTQKPQNSNTKPRFETPAQRYQLIGYPQQQQQQYLQQQQPQSVRPEFQDPQIQFYFPREKDIQAQQQFEEVPQHLVYDTQGVMKVVDPPQLQYQPQQPQEASPRPSTSKYQQQSSKKSQQQQQQAQSSQSVKSQETQRPSAPSRSQIYVSRTTQGPPIPQQPQQQQHQPQAQPQTQNEKPKLPPLKLDPNRPLTQEEFQRLVDQGYNVVPVPVPVPYPVYNVQHQEGEQQRKPEDPQPSQSQKQYFSQSSRPRHHSPAYRPYNQQASASRNVVTYLQPVMNQDSAYSGLRGPSSGSIKK